MVTIIIFLISKQIITLKLFKNLFLTSNLLGSKILDFPIYQIMIHLFLSMIPLHKDSTSRQNAFLCNSLRLYLEFKNQKL